MLDCSSGSEGRGRGVVERCSGGSYWWGCSGGQGILKQHAYRACMDCWREQKKPERLRRPSIVLWNINEFTEGTAACQE